jgi:hypothetical protein
MRCHGKAEWKNTVFPIHEYTKGKGCYEIAGGVGGMTDLLARPCDACEHFIGGGYSHCPKCKIYLCLVCSLNLQKMTKKFPAKCPMCDGEMDW